MKNPIYELLFSADPINVTLGIELAKSQNIDLEPFWKNLKKFNDCIKVNPKTNNPIKLLENFKVNEKNSTLWGTTINSKTFLEIDWNLLNNIEKNVVYLALQDLKLTDEDILKIPFNRFKNLTQIDLNFNNLTKIPTNLPQNIKMLRVSGNQINSFKGIENYPLLENISIHSKLHLENGNLLKGLKNIKYFYCSEKYSNFLSGTNFLSSCRISILEKISPEFIVKKLF